MGSSTALHKIMSQPVDSHRGTVEASAQRTAETLWTTYAERFEKSARSNSPAACHRRIAACSHGCSQSTASRIAGVAPALAGAKTIGVSIQNREAQFYQDMEVGMRAEAAKYGYTLIVVDASRDNAKQQSQVEDFISKSVDAIVLTPYDSQAIGSAIAEANNAEHSGLYRRYREHESRQGTSSRTSPAITCRAALQAGKLICAAVGKSGSVAIIDEPEVTSVQDRVKGFKASDRAALPRRDDRRRRRLGR